jgi:hypothetical protein
MGTATAFLCADYAQSKSVIGTVSEGAFAGWLLTLYAPKGKITSGSAGYIGTVCTDPLGIVIGKVTGQMSPLSVNKLPSSFLWVCYGLCSRTLMDCLPETWLKSSLIAANVDTNLCRATHRRCVCIGPCNHSLLTRQWIA